MASDLGSKCKSYRSVRVFFSLPNEWLISCKRLVETYGPLSWLGAWATAGGVSLRPRLSAVLAG